MNMMIPFNKPFTTGNELTYMAEAIKTGHISGNGKFTKFCQYFFQERYGFKRCLLTTSCTDALEMAAILLNIQPGDEVIAPSYTFVSTVNAFVLRGAKIVFVDSNSNHPGLDEDAIEPLITAKTKVIIPVHYAGVACDMDKIMYIAQKYNLFVVEDAAQAIESHYTGKNGIKLPLGSFGHLAAFSFHETKNIIAGEAGLLVINDDRFIDRAEIIWEKGTNRNAFFKGEVDKYGWVDIGSSFLPSDLIAAFLWAQLERIEQMQFRRIEIWNTYLRDLENWAMHKGVTLPNIPYYSSNNAHMFYLIFQNLIDRDYFISYMKKRGIHCVFHYQSLHKSPFFQPNYNGGELTNADKFSDCLVRLPFYAEINVEAVIKEILAM